MSNIQHHVRYQAFTVRTFVVDLSRLAQAEAPFSVHEIGGVDEFLIDREFINAQK